MISVWYLLWIIPLSGSLGVFIMALFCAHKSHIHSDNEKEAK